jgi:hypothetical protein
MSLVTLVTDNLPRTQSAVIPNRHLGHVSVATRPPAARPCATRGSRVSLVTLVTLVPESS